MINYKQFIISSGTYFFRNQLEQVYSMRCVNDIGYDPYETCFFAGIYNDEDLKRLQNHQGRAYILWLGMDAINKYKVLHVANLSMDVKFLAISKFIEDQFKALEIPYYRIPNIAFTDYTFWESCVLGNKIYCYAPTEHYKLSWMDQIKEYGYDVIVVKSARQHNRESLKELYKECFLGLRLTDFDGNSATVMELGLMGRRSIFNGDNINAINWKNRYELKDLIDKEAERIGTDQTELAESVFDLVTKTTDGWDW